MTMYFNKKESWDVLTFYQIYLKDNVKYIKFTFETDRASLDKPYVSWLFINHGDDCEMKLDDFLEWEVMYQKIQLCENIKSDTVELSPMETYNKVNEIVNNNGKGMEQKSLFDVDEDTLCGYYFM